MSATSITHVRDLDTASAGNCPLPQPAGSASNSCRVGGSLTLKGADERKREFELRCRSQVALMGVPIVAWVTRRPTSSSSTRC